MRQRILERIRGEYLEMPGLRLTLEQARRMWGVDASVCRQVLDILVDEKFLARRANGTYARVTEGVPPRRSSAA